MHLSDTSTTASFIDDKTQNHIFLILGETDRWANSWYVLTGKPITKSCVLKKCSADLCKFMIRIWTSIYPLRASEQMHIQKKTCFRTISNIFDEHLLLKLSFRFFSQKSFIFDSVLNTIPSSTFSENFAYVLNEWSPLKTLWCNYCILYTNSPHQVSNFVKDVENISNCYVDFRFLERLSEKIT